MGSTRALILWAQEAVFASGRATTAVRFIAVSVNCTNQNAPWSGRVSGGWGGDTQSFTLPYDLFHGGIPGGDDCPAAGVPGGCGNLVAGTTRVWETIHGGNASFSSADWYVTNNPTTQNMTKQTSGQPFVYQSGQVLTEISECRHCRHERRQCMDRL